MAQFFKPGKRSSKSADSRSKNLGNSQTQNLTLNIDTLDHQGRGVVRRHQPVVFVDGALPGEQCQVRVTERKKRFWQAEVKRTVSASELRQVPFCPHFSDCGGCQHQHISADDMLVLKQQAVEQLILRQQGMADDYADGLPWQPAITNPHRGYRRKTRLSLDMRNPEQRKLGYRGRKSSKVIPITTCPLLRPALNTLLSGLQSVVDQLKTPACLGHISLIEADNLVQLVVRVVRTPAQQDLALLVALAEQHQAQLVLETRPGEWQVLTSSDISAQILPEQNCRLKFLPADFIQVNDVINRLMVAQAIDWLQLTTEDKVLDLFCGVGNFSLPLARRCQQLIGIEGGADMVQRASDNALLNGISSASFAQADLNASGALANSMDLQPNKILLDPAREGAGGLIPQLAGLNAERIVYVSCNPASFASDAAALAEQRYRISKIALMDMFSYTAHTELMALFEKSH